MYKYQWYINSDVGIVMEDIWEFEEEPTEKALEAALLEEIHNYCYGGYELLEGGEDET